MNFGLLLSQLLHVQESRVHYDAMLALHAREPLNLQRSGSASKLLSHRFLAPFRHTQEGRVLVRALGRQRVPNTS